MKERKNLVILVSNYPSASGEPFLEDELKILESHFDKIYLLKTSLKKNEQSVVELYVPQNATPTELYDNNNALSIVQKTIQFFSLRFMSEFFIARFKHKIPLTIGLVRLAFYYWSNGYKGMLAVRKFIQREKIDIENTIFYSYWCDSHAISLARLKNKNKNLSYITRLHGWDVYFERHQVPFLPFREFIFKNASFVFPISNDGRKYILDKKLSVQPEKIITSRLGVEDYQINVNYQNPKSFSDNKGTLTILTLSTISEVKRLDKIVDAIKDIKSFNIIWHHIGYGKEPFETNFKISTHDKLKNLKNIFYTLHGKFSKKEVTDFLQNTPIDVIVNCSDTEGVPVSLMEAMSAGIPAIAFNVGGIPGIVENNVSGILLDASTKDEILILKNAIEDFYKLSSETKLGLSHNAKKMWETKYNKHINFELFAKILSTNNTDPSPIYCKKCLVGNDIYPEIILDKYGICNICSIIEDKNKKIEIQRTESYLPNLLNQIKTKRGTKKYDSIIGISGGIDSAFLALKAKEWGLNPLLVHVDNGWNSETAVYNIQMLIEKLNLELYTVVIDWNEIKDLVRAFMKASVIDIDWANEMCFQAALYKIAQKFDVKYILTGHQVATEGWIPYNAAHFKLDLINFKYIHKTFGQNKLKTYPMIGYLDNFYYEKIKGIKYYFPLDYIDYNKEDAKKELTEKYGWRDYGQKHFESIFTRFYQAYILPKKFKIDKRRFHYSSLILSGQLTKEEANKLILSEEYFKSGMMEQDKEYIIKKLDFTSEEFENILKAPPKKHTDYPSIINFFDKIRRLKQIIQNN